KPGTDSWEGQVYNAKDGQTYDSTITPHGTDQLEIQGCVLGFLCGGETWTRVGPPIPSSPSNSMAKESTKAAPAPKRAPPKTVGAANPPAAPKSAGAAKGHAPAGDSVGDICLLGDIARFAH